MGLGRQDSGAALRLLVRWRLWPSDAPPPPPLSLRTSIAAIGRNIRAAPAATILRRVSSAGSLRDPRPMPPGPAHAGRAEQASSGSSLSCAQVASRRA
jgi:hypothetical protein